jgi:hypothetical protein
MFVAVSTTGFYLTTERGRGDLLSAACTPLWVLCTQGSNIDRLRAELAAEFRDALLHAYHGPHVDMSARQLPTAFEADERTDPASPDILQLLSGRCNQHPAPALGLPHDEHLAAPAYTFLCEKVYTAHNRQLLGVVRERKDCLLAGSEAPAALDTTAAAPQQQHGSPSATEEQQRGPYASGNSTAARCSAMTRHAHARNYKSQCMFASTCGVCCSSCD